MALGYAAQVGNPPLAGTAAWDRWYNARLAYLREYCPIQRATSYYFSWNTGNDTTGNGTEALPWRSLTKAQTFMATPNIAVLFKRGELWESSGTALTSTAANTIGAYGTGDKPEFAKTATRYTSGWTLVSGTLYKRSLSAGSGVAIGWRVSDRAAGFFTLLQSSAQVGAATTYAMYHDRTGADPNSGGTATLYVNIQTNPNGPMLDFFPNNSAIGIDLQADGARCDSIRVYGYGCDISNFLTQKYGLQASVTGTNAVYFSNCEAYGSGIHLYGLYNNGTGGIAVFENTIAGGGLGDGASMGVAYSSGGTQEAYFDGCITPYAHVPNNYGWSGVAQYGHTSGGANKCGMMIARGCVSRAGTYMAARGTCFNDVPTAAALTDVRAFIVDDVVELPPAGKASIASGFFANVAYVGCRRHLRAEDSMLSYAERGAGNGTAYMSGGSAQGGWIINCFVEIDGSTMRTDQNNWISLCQSESDNRICINSHFRWRLPLNVRGMWFWQTEYFNTSQYAVTNLRMVNCIWERDAVMRGKLAVAANNNTANLKNNAYVGVDTSTSTGVRGYDQDAGRIVPRSTVMGYPVEFIGTFAPLSPHGMFVAGGTTYTGVPDQDMFHRPRPGTVSIGPVDVTYPRAAFAVISGGAE